MSLIALYTYAADPGDLTDQQIGTVATVYEGSLAQCRQAAAGRVYATITPTMRARTIGRRLRATLGQGRTAILDNNSATR